MEAVIEFYNGDIDTVVGLKGYARAEAEALASSHPSARRIWMYLDEAGETYQDAMTRAPEFDADGGMMLAVVMREDGETAELELPSMEDLWAAIAWAFPESYDVITEDMVRPEGSDGARATFRKGSDMDLADWLSEVLARVVDVDVQGRRKVVHEVEGERTWAVATARDWATAFVEGSGVDTAEMDVRVMVGGEEVWSWLEASQ